MKMKLNGEGIKQFLLTNGEKIGLGITVVILLLFLYSAITAKPLEDAKSPDAIRQESTNLTSRIQAPSWQDHLKETPEAVQPVPYSDKLQQLTEVVPKAPYVWPIEIDKPLFPDLVKRADPQIYPVEELQISASRGIVPYAAAATTAGAAIPAVNNFGGGTGSTGTTAQNQHFQTTGMTGFPPPSGSEPVAKYYAIITGAIPFEKQREEYSKKFQNAVPAVPLNATDSIRPGTGMQAAQPQPGQTDEPVWFIFRVERAEAIDGKAADQLKWEKVNYQEAALDTDKWAAKPPQTPEIVAKDYIFDGIPYPPNTPTMNTYITWPLPPLLLKNWGLEASHPKVKLIETGAQQEAPAVDNTAPQQNLEDLGGLTPPPAGAAPVAAKAGTAPPRPGAAPGPAPMTGGFGGSNPRQPGLPAGGFGGFGGGGPMAGQLANQAAQVPAVKYKLFRFVDLTAVPGKTYRYRIQLVLKNPNFNLRADCLDPKVVKTKDGKVSEWVLSPWSETPPVTIPRDFQLLADSIVYLRGQEPKAKFDVVAFIKAAPAAETQSGSGDVWLEAKSEVDVPLGAIADLRNETFKDVVDPSATVIRTVDKVAIDSNQTTLLDVRNDDPMGNSKSGPAEVLLMDGSGRLTIANSAADGLIVKDFMERIAVQKDLNAAPAPVVPQPKAGGKAAPPIRPNPVVTPKGAAGKKEAQ